MPSNRYSCINAASLDLRTQVARNKKPRQCLLNRLDLDEYILNCNGIKRNQKFAQNCGEKFNVPPCFYY